VGASRVGSHDHAQNWAIADTFGHLLQLVRDRHLNERPSAIDRVYHSFQPASLPWAAEKGWASLGWRAAAGASVVFDVRKDHIELSLFNHGWTDGAALEMRDPILRLCRSLRKEHPRYCPWSPQGLEFEHNHKFVEAAVLLVNDYWQGLEEIGAFEVDRWAYWMPPEASS
jgi:hypothetical protein